MSAETTQPQVKITWLLGTLVAFALFAVIAIYSSRMTWDYPDYDKQRAADRLDTLAKLRADESKTLNGPADWVDQTKGTVHIPIEEAMAIELDTLKSEAPMIGCEITVAAPAPATTNAAPANAKAPASGATNAAPATATPPPAKEKK